MKARILGTIFLIVALALVYGFTQDDRPDFGGTSPHAQPQQSVPSPNSQDNDLRGLKIN